MFNNIEEFKSFVCGKNVCVIGIGISNTPLIRLLIESGAYVTACDKKERTEFLALANELCDMGVKLNLGENYLKNINADIIFKTPGLRFDVPELIRAQKNGALVTSEMEVFFEICPAEIIAVTGSDGKTTTTTLIYEMLKNQGYTCHLGGNIGSPLLCKTGDIKPNDYVVVELSSFQLHTMKKSPHIAIITNLSPNHLDTHKNYQEYIDAKKNIMLYQNAGDTVILNRDNEVTDSLSACARGKVLKFSRKHTADICLCDEFITVFGEKILNINDIKIPGNHNIENYMAAIGALHTIVKPQAILKTAREFGGVPHRIELVRALNGVKYYNSSIDSSPNRTINTLSVFNKKVILIAGGKDKGISYDELGEPLLNSVKELILIGKTKDVIKNSVVAAAKKLQADIMPIYEPKTYDEAVHLAKQLAKSGDVVLLSNASTSFDMFKNFEERGNLFKELVNKL